jgi:hypothetical protein
LPTPGGAQDDDVVAVLDEVTAGQLLDLLGVDGRLVGEVEGFQRLDGKRAMAVRMAMFLVVLAETSSPRTCSRNSA